MSKDFLSSEFLPPEYSPNRVFAKRNLRPTEFLAEWNFYRTEYSPSGDFAEMNFAEVNFHRTDFSSSEFSPIGFVAGKFLEVLLADFWWSRGYQIISVSLAANSVQIPLHGQ